MAYQAWYSQEPAPVSSNCHSAPCSSPVQLAIDGLPLYQVQTRVLLRVYYTIIPAFIAYCHAYTPCLNAFWHSDPYICLYLLGNAFLSCSI